MDKLGSFFYLIYKEKKMTIQTETSKAVYISDGITTEFPVPFRFFANHIAVYKNMSDTPLQEGIDYQINNTEHQTGGVVIFSQAPSAGETITIVRNVELKQLITFLEGENFPATDFENALDKLTMAIQQIRETLSRTVTVPNGSTITKEEVFQCLEKLHQNFEQILRTPEYVEEILNSATDTVTADDTHLITSGGVYNYTYSSAVIDNKIIQSVRKIYNLPITITEENLIESDDVAGYPYKYNKSIMNVTSDNCPVVMFSNEDALSSIFSPLATTYSSGISLYLNKKTNLETTIPLILLL